MDESATISTDSGTLNLNSPTDYTKSWKCFTQDVWQVKKSLWSFLLCTWISKSKGEGQNKWHSKVILQIQKQTRLLVKLIWRDKWEPKKHDRICSDHFEGGMHCFILYLHVVNPGHFKSWGTNLILSVPVSVVGVLVSCTKKWAPWSHTIFFHNSIGSGI
jgi:hypothetical protein